MAKDLNLNSDESDDAFLKSYKEKLLKKLSNFNEYTDEEELINITTEKKIIVHFYSSSFKKCKLMNEVLKKIAKNFPSLNFGIINVGKCPKMCTSLKIKVLPFLAFFKDGFFIDEVVGFEKIGNNENLNEEMLEKYIRDNEIYKNTKISG